MFKLISVIVISITLLCTVLPVFAQTGRTTPVEVKNPIEISPSANVVKSTQQGAWNVEVTGTPSVNVANTPNVSIANTPNVNITNVPTVNTPTQRSLVLPWSSNVTLAPGESSQSNLIDCTGYKEIRVRLGISHASTAIKIRMYWQVGGHLMQEGTVSFSHTESIIKGATPEPSLAFTMPILSDRCLIQVYNGSTNPISFASYASWDYLVN